MLEKHLAAILHKTLATSKLLNAQAVIGVAQVGGGELCHAVVRAKVPFVPLGVLKNGVRNVARREIGCLHDDMEIQTVGVFL